MTKTLEYYLRLAYRVLIPLDDEGFGVEVPLYCAY